LRRNSFSTGRSRLLYGLAGLSSSSPGKVSISRQHVLGGSVLAAGPHIRDTGKSLFDKLLQVLA
jgi:hypothetical protein